MEAAKTQVLATSGVVVGVGAIGAFVPEPRALDLLGWAFAALVVSLASNVAYMYLVASDVRADNPQRRRLRPTTRILLSLSIAGFFAGLLVFLFWIDAQV